MVVGVDKFGGSTPWSDVIHKGWSVVVKLHNKDTFFVLHFPVETLLRWNNLCPHKCLQKNKIRHVGRFPNKILVGPIRSDPVKNPIRSDPTTTLGPHNFVSNNPFGTKQVPIERPRWDLSIGSGFVLIRPMCEKFVAIGSGHRIGSDRPTKVLG